MAEDPDDFSFDKLTETLEGTLTQNTSETMANGELNELEHDYFKTIKKAKTTVVMFYRTACPYCKKLRPILENLADEFETSVFFAAVNIDSVDDAREKYNIFGVPLVIALKKGLPVGRIEGLRAADDYYEWIEMINKGLRPMRFDAGEASPL